jgi:hypothetical protein
VLPEIKSIQKAQYRLDSHLQDSLPILLEAGRETGYFEYHQYTEFKLEKYGLLEVINDPDTTVPVNVAVTFDGGSVSRFLGHVTGGYKLVDKRAKHPKTKEALFGESGHEKRQSHVHCFPIKIALAKDTKELYKVEFNDLFLRAYEQEKGFRIKFLFPQDMSSISQVFLSSINELHNKDNPYDIEYQPATLDDGIAFDAF